VTRADNQAKFLEVLSASLGTDSFCKVTLSKPAPGYRWKRAVVSAFANARGEREISFEYSDSRQVERKNVPCVDTMEALTPLITNSFRSAYLRTLTEEYSFERTDKDTYRLKYKQLSSPPPELPSHNRQKHHIVPADAPFLREVGITSHAGIVRRERFDKFRQIQKFVEVIASMIPDEALSNENGLRVVDFGSGKHYLTFALHHFLTKHSANHRVIGVEQRQELVAAGQEIASRLGHTELEFIAGTIASTTIEKTDLVVALHACDTATDDALAKALNAQARYICVAPCCHKYVRQKFAPSQDLLPMLRHGILAERFADGLTDSLRVLALEGAGYQTKLFEFISPEHTAKNTIITAVRTGRRNSDSLRLLRDLCHKFALADFYLDTKIPELFS